MQLKEKIEKLMRNKGIRNYIDLLKEIYGNLGEANPLEKAEKEKGNFTKMLKGERELNTKFYIPLEKIFEIRIADLLSDTERAHPSFRNGGLRYAAATNDYGEFERLGKERTGEDSLVIFHFDEYHKNIFDYIIQYRAFNGVKYLANEFGMKYSALFRQMQATVNQCFCYGENVERIADVIFEIDDGKTFIKVFHSYDSLKDYGYAEKTVYENESFLKKILNSKNIFEAYLSKAEIELSEINHDKLQDGEKTGLFINPILNRLLDIAMTDPKRYEKQISRILDYGMLHNGDVVMVTEDRHSSQVYDFEINERGGITVGHRICGSVVTVKEDYINPDITAEMRYRISSIREINNRLTVKEKMTVSGAKRLQRNAEGNILKVHTENAVEYEMYNDLKDSDLPIAKLLGTKDGVDEFAPYVGQNMIYSVCSDNMLISATEFFKELHSESERILDSGKVYTHGNIIGENLYFSDGILTNVVNWDFCRVGEKWEDLSLFILNFSDVDNRYRINADVCERIHLILKTYGADKKFKQQILDYISQYITDCVSKLDLSDEDCIKQYENLEWCKIFFTLYAKKLIEE